MIDQSIKILSDINNSANSSGLSDAKRKGGLSGYEHDKKVQSYLVSTMNLVSDLDKINSSLGKSSNNGNQNSSLKRVPNKSKDMLNAHEFNLST